MIGTMVPGVVFSGTMAWAEVLARAVTSYWVSVVKATVERIDSVTSWMSHRAPGSAGMVPFWTSLISTCASTCVGPAPTGGVNSRRPPFRLEK